MIALGACTLDRKHTFVDYIKPISEQWVPEALAVSGFSREQTLLFNDPYAIMGQFNRWIRSTGDAPYVFYADNNGFDWQFVNWYFHHFRGSNPFGFSSRNINDIFHGLRKDMRASFKRLRKTAHDHNPLNDAIGNAEALEAMIERYGLKGKF